MTDSQKPAADAPRLYVHTHPDRQFVDALRFARHTLVFTHQRPDPDALGSQAAMAIMLRRIGVLKVEVVNFEPLPRQYAYLQENLSEQGIAILQFSPDWTATPPAADRIVVVDTCSFNQLEPAAPFLRSQRAKIMVADHHLGRDDLSDHILADTGAAAAAEIVWHLARHIAELPMDAALALPLMSGLVADTGWFRFDSVRPRTHLMAADLVPHVKSMDIYEHLQLNETASKLGLIQRALASLTWLGTQQAAIMTLTQKDFLETAATQSQTEELVNLPMMVTTAEVTALLTETPEGRVRGSLRAKHYVDVNKLAKQFGGGGHAKAAGLRMEGPLAAAKERLATAILAAIVSRDPGDRVV